MIAAPATSSAVDVARGLHEDAHADVSDPALSDADREALVEWHLDNAREHGPDTDARETFASALTRWSASADYRRDLVSFLTYPEPIGATRQEVEERKAREIEERRERDRERRRRDRSWHVADNVVSLDAYRRARRSA